MIRYHPVDLLKKIAPKSKVEKLIKNNLTPNKAALSFLDDVDFLDKKSVERVALKTIKQYKERVEEESIPDPPILTETEKDAIHFYKRTGYGPVNGKLRGFKVQGAEKAEETIKTLDGAIEKSFLQKDTTVFRGMYQVADLRALGKKGIGQEIKMPTFWSVSPDKATAEQFTLANSSKTGVLLEIKLKKGHNALDATVGTNEKEFILPRNQAYEITGFKPGKGDQPPTYILEPKEPPKLDIVDDVIKEEIIDNPKQLIQRVQNNIVNQIAGEIKDAYRGEYYKWLPSDAAEPDPIHQLKYGKRYQVGKGEMPGDRYGCRCGMFILVKETKLKL